ncbi:Alpha/Beta hydrolase protein [Plectosphaerella plurivora]|uniref:Alpha/Beta hydrolase protein n=1 Tax=Plectosphaerella plurivora TaxID=936078 RepID=A0A9P9AG81_9PEZI|nr:Alpha/Beta hydrolase protein [Plectosphaerella plurivora]
MAKISLKHPLLGSVTGVGANKGVVEYLGIPYATLQHPFAASEIKTRYEGAIDATEFGPTVIAPPLGCDIEFGLIQQPLEKPQIIPPVSDLDGLNLNITVPEGEHRLLPVLVFVHGGGFLFGGNWAPHYDLGPIVAHAASIGRPIIGVAINYRLGAPGFLDSEELRANGLPRNRGLLDQKIAFQWLAKYIAGFGGDPKNLTAFGQSAGGSSVMHLLDLETPKPLFQRLACLSGNKIAAALVPASVAQGAYFDALEALGINPGMPASDQVAALASKTGKDILSDMPMTIPFGPVVDDEVVPTLETAKSGPPPKLQVPLFIGSTDFDGVVYSILGIFAGRKEKTLGQDFATAFVQALPVTKAEAARALLTLYGLPHAVASDADAEIRILQFGTDIKYFTASTAFAASWPVESWLYYFMEPNPWEGPHKGRATHVQDVAYAFLNFEHLMNEDQIRVARGFASDVIKFAHGEKPWPEFRSEGKMRVYGDSGKDSDAVRSLGHGDAGPSAEVRALWKEIGNDNLSTAWDTYFLRK